MGEWNDFYVATVGAAAALTGLLFIGLSINLKKILEYPSLPTRAFVSVTLLMSVLLISMLLLIPRGAAKEAGYFVLLVGVLAWLLVTGAGRRIYHQTHAQYRWELLLNLLFDQVAVLPYIVGGVVMLVIGDTGLYWVAVAFIFSFIKAVSDAWVLLIEIMR